MSLAHPIFLAPLPWYLLRSLRCRIHVIDLSIVAGHLISNCSLKFDKYICLMVYALHGKTKQKQPSLMRCVCVCWLCFCFDNFVLDCLLLCQLDVRQSNLASRSHIRENAYIRLACGKACATASWLMIDVNRPSSLWVAPSLG